MFDHAAFLADPYPFYRELVAAGPVHRLELLGGAWTFPRHAECAALLRDPRLSARRSDVLVLQFPEAERARLADFQRRFARWMLFYDPPEHTRIRRAMLRGFRPEVLDGLRTRIEALVGELLDAAAAEGGMDAVRGLAYPLPALVIAEMMGLPAADRGRLMAWSDAVADFFGASAATLPSAERAQAALAELTDYFAAVVAARRRDPGEDLVSQLVAHEEELELSDEELLAQCAMLLFAGHETTRNLIGNGLLALLRHPDQLARLRADPGLGRSAADELLRWDSPVQFGSRLVAEPIEVGGCALGRGELVILLLGAANRDPAEFPDPDRLDLGRRPNRHLSFGHGPHLCMGAHLARLEAEVAFNTLLARFPGLRLASEEVEWNPNFGFRGLKALAVEF